MRTYFHRDDYTSFQVNLPDSSPPKAWICALVSTGIDFFFFQHQNFTPPDTIMYTHYNAVEKETNAMVSIFTYGFSQKRHGESALKETDAKRKLPEKWIIINALQRLKTIRHPGIIKFKEAILTENYLYVITEPVIPLSKMWNDLPAEEIALGIHRTLQTVQFLHNNELCHNNLQFSSLYVSVRERSWLLGGLEFTTPFQDITKTFTNSLANSIPTDIIPPEDYDPNVTPGLVQSRDFYALGHLLTHLLSPLLSPTNLVKQDAFFDWRDLQRLADMMTAMSPFKRIGVQQVLESAVLSNNQFIFVVHHLLKNMRALEPSEKILGFRKIAPLIRTLPATTVTAYILPLILNTELFGEPGIEIILRDVFSQKTTNEEAVAILPASSFTNFVIPFISNSLKRREFDIRRTMLKLYSCYFEVLFDANPVQFSVAIMPELLVGLNESNEEIYVDTLAALCMTIPRLFLHEFEQEKRTASATTPLAQRESFAPSSNGIRRSSVNGAKKMLPGFTPIPASVLVQSYIIPRVLNACVDPQLSVANNVVLLKGLVDMWKQLCCLESKHAALKATVFLLSSSFKTVLGVISKDIKYSFVTDVLVGGMGGRTYRDGEEHWMPKVLEILVPFLISPDEHLRSIICDITLQSVTLIAQYPSKPIDLDYATPITDRRIERMGNAIIHSGPKRQPLNIDESALILDDDCDAFDPPLRFAKTDPPLPAKIPVDSFEGEFLGTYPLKYSKNVEQTAVEFSKTNAKAGRQPKSRVHGNIAGFKYSTSNQRISKCKLAQGKNPTVERWDFESFNNV
ncbi:Protein-associating with the carboxyl-terminal domain of ezrin [Podochytrium sp. JEL0797]|nr:Protein-associating with the carboxyl-terminal domain of ezrin [Podochytrium sp. JEL0797]